MGQFLLEGIFKKRMYIFTVAKPEELGWFIQLFWVDFWLLLLFIPFNSYALIHYN